MVRTGGNQIANTTNKKTQLLMTVQKNKTLILEQIVRAPHDTHIHSYEEIAMSGYN